jgi:hypothetical protein
VLSAGLPPQMWAAHEGAIASALAEAMGVPADDPTPYVLAGQALGG